MKSEVAGEIAIALIREELGFGFGIAVQVGAGMKDLTSLARQRLRPPASIVLESLGSSMNGAMKLAFWGLGVLSPASLMPK